MRRQASISRMREMYVSIQVQGKYKFLHGCPQKLAANTTYICFHIIHQLCYYWNGPWFLTYILPTWYWQWLIGLYGFKTFFTWSFKSPPHLNFYTSINYDTTVLNSFNTEFFTVQYLYINCFMISIFRCFNLYCLCITAYMRSSWSNTTAA